MLGRNRALLDPAGTAGFLARAHSCPQSRPLVCALPSVHPCVPTLSWMHVSCGVQAQGLRVDWGHPPVQLSPCLGPLAALDGLVGHCDRAGPLPTPPRRRGGDWPRPEAPGLVPCSKPELELQVTFPAGMSKRGQCPLTAPGPSRTKGRSEAPTHPGCPGGGGPHPEPALAAQPRQPELAVGMGAGAPSCVHLPRAMPSGLRLYSQKGQPQPCSPTRCHQSPVTGGSQLPAGLQALHVLGLGHTCLFPQVPGSPTVVSGLVRPPGRR